MVAHVSQIICSKCISGKCFSYAHVHSYNFASSLVFHNATSGPCFPYTGSAFGVGTSRIIEAKEFAGCLPLSLIHLGHS